MNTLKRASCIKRNSNVTDPYANSIKFGPNMDLNSIITPPKEGEIKAVIEVVRNKFEMDCEAEIEEHRKACIESINKINGNKNSSSFNLVIEVNNMKWEERNMTELLFPEKGGKSIYIFNPLLNKIEQIFLDTDDEFPIALAICNRLPYCFCCGGKVKVDDDYVELNDFYTLKRTGINNFEKIFLPPMLEEKTNHCLFEVPYYKSICTLGGANSKDAEVFDLEEKTWSKLPELNCIREGASCAMINDTLLFCFFGYDTENSEYLTSIEKLDLEKEEGWKLMNPFGNKSFMKRKFFSCLQYRQNFEDFVFILGGINILNNESQDWMEYNEKNNTVEKMESNMPYKSSFFCNSFTKLPNGRFYNLTSDYQLIQYESLGKYIFGIREK